MQKSPLVADHVTLRLHLVNLNGHMDNMRMTGDIWRGRRGEGWSLPTEAPLSRQLRSVSGDANGTASPKFTLPEGRACRGDLGRRGNLGIVKIKWNYGKLEFSRFLTSTIIMSNNNGIT